MGQTLDMGYGQDRPDFRADKAGYPEFLEERV